MYIREVIFIILYNLSLVLINILQLFYIVVLCRIAMPPFRWHLKHELALLKELTANKPATAKDWATTWKSVSNGINQAVSVATSPRSCRDHFNNALVSKFHKDNRESLKRYTLFNIKQ